MVTQSEVKICLLNDTLEPMRVGDLVVMKSGGSTTNIPLERMPCWGYKSLG